MIILVFDESVEDENLIDKWMLGYGTYSKRVEENL